MGELKAEDGTPVLRRTGGVLLGARADLERLQNAIPEATAESRALANDARLVGGDALRARWPWLGASADDGALVTDGCGVVDIHALLSTGLRALGKNVVLKASLDAVLTDARGAMAGVVVDGERIATPRLVNAAGFRANQVAAMAGAKPFPFNPVRRHLFTTAPNDTITRDAPWFWDIGRGWYLRPEGAGLLLCACDATPWPDDAPDDPPRDPAAREWAAARFTASLPALSNLRIHRDWAGLRILTPDQAFVIGPDPEVGGFFWVAGLGGHGMTTACGVGELAADLVLGREVPALFRDAFDPGRLRGA
jgi:glycine/D-amino acid oxidase-like deaminating enzyme